MQQENYTDEELVSKVREGGKAFEDISMYMFNEFKGFLPKIKEKLNLPQQQIQDAYADALVKLIRKLRDGSFRGESKVSSYFYTIFYNTSVDVSRKNASNKNKQTLELLEHDARETDLLKLIDNKDEANQVIAVMKTMGDMCQRILMDWGYYGYSMNEIATRSDLSNAESARSMKYKCLKKLRELLNTKMYNV